MIITAFAAHRSFAETPLFSVFKVPLVWPDSLRTGSLAVWTDFT